MKNKLDLSIIVVSYNTKDWLQVCLQSIYSSISGSKLNLEVIVVDNNSIDDSPAMIKTKFPQVRLIQNTQNLGFSTGNNQGVNAAQAKTILLLNSDIQVLNQAIDNLYKFFHKQKFEVIVAGKLFNIDRTPQDSCGSAYTLPMIFTALFLKGDHLHITRYSPDKIKEVDWVMGACMMMAKASFIKLGGFDEKIFMYMEEIDFQYRAKKQGMKIYFFPDAKFLHKGAASSRDRVMPILNVFKGLLFFYKKHKSYWQIILLRVILVLKAFLAIILFTLLGKSNDQKLYRNALQIALKY